MIRTGWHPTLGAIVDPDRTTFSVWAPAATIVDLMIDTGQSPDASRPMVRGAEGHFSVVCERLEPGTRYRYRLDGCGSFPDPAGRFQPDGVHGPSMTVDPSTFAWTDGDWAGIALSDLVIYELHIGTFSPAGTFLGAADQLEALRDLGITAIELMPVADFPGSRNWGYDGVSLFAPARCYGTPDELRRLIDRAHALGLAVLLDVVYNHLGPDGAYLQHYSEDYLTHRHHSPWGAGLNLDGDASPHVRQFFIENALHWIHEYHLDGLRLDATHALRDRGPRHFLSELSARVHDSVADRHVHLIAEDDRNLARLVTPIADGGWGLDALWTDDLHHQLRRALAGDSDGYFGDYTGSTTDLAATIRQGWFFAGQHSPHLRAPRGTDPAGVPPRRCVQCLQNHDQIGNRAFGERLHHQIEPAAFRAASLLLLMLPHTPLLFMGQEWAASSPFLYFTDHHAELGRLVTEGRRREFRTFKAFADEAARAVIPDPQAAATFERSRLAWQERDREPHAATLRLYAALLAFRRHVLAAGDTAAATSARALDADTIGFCRPTTSGDTVLVVVRLRGAGSVDFRPLAPSHDGAWTAVMSSDDPAFGGDGTVECDNTRATLSFSGPAAIILRSAAVEAPSV